MTNRSTHRTLAAALAGLIAGPLTTHVSSLAQDEPQAPARPAEASPALSMAAKSPADAIASLIALARERPSMIGTRDIATSPGRRPITVWTLSSDPATADSRPGVLLVAGLDADRPAHVWIASDAVRQLVDQRAALLSEFTVYVIPCANPDALLGDAPRIEGSPSRNARPVDDDRDGVRDEDGPRDIDENGHITSMRRPNPPPGDPATHAADPADLRLMRTPDPLANARAAFSVHPEGMDTDGDGRIAEDPVGGVDVDCNFPARWPEFAPHAGAFQLSEPESAAIARFVLERPRIVGALCLGRWESLARTPDPKPRDATGKTPMELDAGDEALWKELGRSWRDASGQSRWTDDTPGGCLALWLYAHRGLPAFSTQAWGRPDVPKTENGDGAATKGADTRDAKSAEENPASSRELTPSDAEAAAWLAISDRARAGAGFVAWASFAHPTLGPVEIGGFEPGFRRNPPPEACGRAADAVTAFVATLGERRPRVRIDTVTVDELSPGVRRIRMRIANDGWLPTCTAMGKTNGAPAPIVVRTSMAPAELMSGPRAARIASLDGYGAEDLEWVVAASDTAPIRIDVRWSGMDAQSALIQGTAVQLVAVPTKVLPIRHGGAT